MQKTPHILLMVESSRTCERDFLRGIARYARTHGPWVFYHKPKFYLTSNRRTISIQQVQRFNPDGIIISDVENMDSILKLELPIIIHTFKSNEYDFPMVLGDTQQTGKMGAEHLLGLGFKHYAYCGIGNYYWSKERYRSFSHTIQQAGFTVLYYELSPQRIRNARQNEFKSLMGWLESLPKPLGLMTCADDCSQYIVEACKIADIHIPEEISIIGVDNDDMICEFSNPALSSIVLNFEAAGYQSAELLDHLISENHVDGESIIVKPTHIEVRSSTDILAIDDPDVATALQFIRTHSNQLIQIADVMNEVICCQRLLHTKFKQTLGRSVHQEIKRVRIERISTMLRETSLSISQIAYKLGYSNANHLARYFQEAMSMTPLAYRKSFNIT